MILSYQPATSLVHFHVHVCQNDQALVGVFLFQLNWHTTPPLGCKWLFEIEVGSFIVPASVWRLGMGYDQNHGEILLWPTVTSHPHHIRQKPPNYCVWCCSLPLPLSLSGVSNVDKSFSTSPASNFCRGSQGAQGRSPTLILQLS